MYDGSHLPKVEPPLCAGSLTVHAYGIPDNAMFWPLSCSLQPTQVATTLSREGISHIKPDQQRLEVRVPCAGYIRHSPTTSPTLVAVSAGDHHTCQDLLRKMHITNTNSDTRPSTILSLRRILWLWDTWLRNLTDLKVVREKK